MRINHNISSMTTQGALFTANRSVAGNLEKLSTGLRINRASDDAAGLSISENLRAQVKGTAQAKKNALDGISLLNIAEGAANEISSVLQRMRELAIQSASDTLTNTERSYANQEFSQLREEIDRIADVTNFNGQSLISKDSGSAGRFGSGTTGSTLWIDANDQIGKDSLTITIDTMSSDSTGLKLDDDTLSSQTSSFAAITALDGAIGSVNAMRSDLGSWTNRLESTINNLTISNTNQAAAESQIRDVDFAYESSQFTKNQILTQSANAMLAQANQVSQGVLSLLQ